MAIDLPTVVIEAPAPRTARPLATLAVAPAALHGWEQHADVRAVDLAPDAGPRMLPVAADHAARLTSIEAALHAARATLDLGEPSGLDAVRALLAAAYDSARAHPEDAEAPWLLAETLRLSAQAEALAGDTDAAAILRARARLLDDGRVLGLSEGFDVVAAVPTVEVTVIVDGAPPGARVRLDGAAHDAATPFRARIALGEHHLRVTANDPDGLDRGVLLARWVTVNPADVALHASIVDDPAPCSARDLASALDALTRGSTFAVRCPRWAVARRLDGASLEVRSCDDHSCAAGETWLALPGKPGPSGARGDEGGAGSAWRSGWTYAALGAAALTVGSLAAWRLGAFDRPQSPPPAWRWEGVR